MAAEMRAPQRFRRATASEAPAVHGAPRGLQPVAPFPRQRSMRAYPSSMASMGAVAALCFLASYLVEMVCMAPAAALRCLALSLALGRD
jgi:hypothetical protein